ncbi:MAG TPA: PEP-CTERM sorting domain-containing protein [Candidatus Limnocylindrales bacterium]|nr:PEP-CTERM sorting domain-containing protein [Candidatus Limnocylindrales bacterium]
MKMKLFVSLALAGTLFIPAITRAQFASSVASYSQGNVNNNAYYETFNDPTSALGAPSTETVDPIYGNSPVDPFEAPYLPNQIVGIGGGGSLTLQFNTPILNNPNNPLGLDFIIFGHAGFNEDFSTGTAVDGSLYTGGTSDVRVSVSSDGSTFYELNPALAPQVDGLYPTDGSGNPFLPVNPALTAANFAGQDLNGIRALYNGSAGGAGFSLAWAIDSNGNSVSLSSVNYVRLDGVSGVAFIDAMSVVVPEPATWALVLTGVGLLFLRRRV